MWAEALLEGIFLLKPRRNGFLFDFQGQSVPWEASGVLLSSSGVFPNTSFLFGPSGVLGSRFGFSVLGSGESPIFQKIPGRSRSGAFSIRLLHEIVDFWPNVGRGPFGGYFSAKTSAKRVSV